TFPDSHWNNLAQRSGQEFGWLLVIAGLIWLHRRRRWLGIGVLLLALGILPNALNPNLPWHGDSLWSWVMGGRPAMGRLSLLEVALIIAGLAIMGWQLQTDWKKLPERARSSLVLTILLIAPFTMVWFWGYSYHYRLMLTITPAIVAIVAALIDSFHIRWERLAS